ncbi:hypothetical protein ACQUKI_05545 [Ralstonia pseudosolanacearum]
MSVIATRGRFIIRGSCSVGGSGQACADRRADRMIPCRLPFKCTVALQMAIGGAICAVQCGCPDYFHPPSALSNFFKILYWLGVDSFYFLLAIGLLNFQDALGKSGRFVIFIWLESDFPGIFIPIDFSISL